MSLVRAKDTKPELRVRKLVHSLGYRYRLHVRKLLGCPDLVFPCRRKVIFVHGCFWHQHKCKLGDRMPKSRVVFWRRKLEGNKKRDRAVRRQLREAGWRVMAVWECQTTPAKMHDLASRIVRFLEA